MVKGTSHRDWSVMVVHNPLNNDDDDGNHKTKLHRPSDT